MNWCTAMRIVGSNFLDSGAMQLYAGSLYGSFLTLVYFAGEKTGATAQDDRPSVTTGPGLRIKVGYALFFLKLPLMLTFVWVAKIKWLWISIPSEILLSLLIEVFIPEGAQSAHAFLVRRRRWKELSKHTAHNTFSSMGPWLQYIVAFSLLPLQEPVAWFCRQYGLMTKLSPLSDGLKAFAVAVFVMIKAVELQYYSSLQLLSYVGVGYLDSVPLGYEARHGHCDLCLVYNELTSNDSVQRVGLQVLSFFLP